MKKINISVIRKIALVFLVFPFACKDEPLSPSFEDLLTGHSWRWAGCIKGNNDCYINQPDCDKDDATTFFPEGGIKFEDTGIDCDSNPNNNISIGNWEKINDLRIKVNGVTWDILELTENKLRIEYTATGSPGAGGREIWIYEH